MAETVIERGALVTLQEAVAKALNDDHFFSDIKVLTERVEDLDNEIQQALAGLSEHGGSVGVAVVVITPRARSTKENLRGPHMDDVNVTVRVLERVLINKGENGTKKPASLVAEVAATIMHHLMIPGYHAAINVQEIGLVYAPGMVAYDVRATTQVTLKRKEN